MRRLEELEGIFGKAVELDKKEKFGLDTGKRSEGYREKVGGI